MIQPGTSLAIVALMLLSLGGCIDVNAEVDRRKDIITGAVSNKVPPDSSSQPSDLTTTEAVATEIGADSTPLEIHDVGDGGDAGADLDGETLDAAATDICAPQCDGLECGPDMCGGLCGFCPGDEICTLGQCKNCKPDCDFKECGADGCGSTCGLCPSKFSCVSNKCKAPTCSSDEQIYFENFDSCSQGGFGIFDTNPDDNVTWWGLPLQFHSPPCGLYLGDPQTMDYDTGSTIHVELLSPVLVLPAGVALQLTFHLYMLTEVLPSPLYPYDHDVLFLFYESENDGITTEVWSSKSNLNSTSDIMVPMAIDLSAHGGTSGRFRFVFDTLNSTDNDNPGIYLDDFSIASICPYCKVDEDCLDDDPCTDESCLHFTNFPDIGTCLTEPLLECCLNDPDSFCEDADPCTLDLCDPVSATCTHDPIPDCPPPEEL